jgi:hypothetical protein
VSSTYWYLNFGDFGGCFKRLMGGRGIRERGCVFAGLWSKAFACDKLVSGKPHFIFS